MNETQPIEKKDVQEVLGHYQGNTYFQKALQKGTPENIADTIVKYVYFNRLFGAGVAHLASQLALQTSLFKDPREGSNLWNDRSMDVASGIFAAAIDEFGDRGLSSHPTHRKLAQAIIKGIAEYSGYEVEKVDLKYIERMIDPKVRTGYGVAASLEENVLFRSIGFHIGSELLADQEFRTLDTALRTRYPKLVKTLEDATVKISGEDVPAYRWIGIHMSVEIDHFAHAVRAANVALQYYGGSQPKSKVRKQILQGIEEFAQFQHDFMKYLHQGAPTL